MSGPAGPGTEAAGRPDPAGQQDAAGRPDPAEPADLAERAALAAALRTGTAVSHWAARQPDSPAVTSPLGDRTFAELDADANRLARVLRRRGLGPGDAVALMVANRPEFAVVLAATQRSGLRLTPINWHLTAEEAAYIVDDCEARALVADTRFAAVAAGAASRAPAATARLAVGGDVEGFEPFADALAAENGAPLDEPVLGGSMLYTSGTTGRPKGVHRPPVATARLQRSIVPPFGYEPGRSRHLCTGPLYHAAPLAFSLVGPLSAGPPQSCPTSVTSRRSRTSSTAQRIHST